MFAFLISSSDRPFEGLKRLLKEVGLDVWACQNCQESARLLDQTYPELIFTAATASDGNWSDIIRLAEEASVPTNLIVVGRHQNAELYLSTIDYGAFDFILPPFESDPMAHFVRVTVEDVRRRREAQAMRTGA